jgi:hypothetical protein
MVELNPGYPGYRGFVTGLYGAGEAACLETLERLSPWFDRDQEDKLNARAARRLGLTGDASTWVWENWLAIEVERGSGPVCYLKAYAQMAAGVPFERMLVAPDDARLRVGQIDSSGLIGRVAAEAGVPRWRLENVFHTDYQLRATAWAALGNVGYPQVDAVELESAIIQIAEEMDRLGGSIRLVAPLIQSQGGYAPVPATACPLDQIFLAWTAMSVHTMQVPGQVGTAMLNVFEQHITGWQSALATGSTLTLREYLIENEALP